MDENTKRVHVQRIQRALEDVGDSLDCLFEGRENYRAKVAEVVEDMVTDFDVTRERAWQIIYDKVLFCFEEHEFDDAMEQREVG